MPAIPEEDADPGWLIQWLSMRLRGSGIYWRHPLSNKMHRFFLPQGSCIDPQSAAEDIALEAYNKALERQEAMWPTPVNNWRAFVLAQAIYITKTMIRDELRRRRTLGFQTSTNEPSDSLDEQVSSSRQDHDFSLKVESALDVSRLMKALDLYCSMTFSKDPVSADLFSKAVRKRWEGLLMDGTMLSFRKLEELVPGSDKSTLNRQYRKFEVWLRTRGQR